MIKKNSKKDAVGIGYIIAGIVFLFNPVIGIYDVLPDFIGYLLAYRGFFMLSFCTDKLKDVRGYLWKLTIIAAARVLSFLFLPGKDPSFTLLLVFVFGVFELIYGIPFIVRMFDGFYDLGRRFGAQSVYGPKKTTEAAEGLKTYTVIFFIIKAVASLLPELTALDVNYELSSTSKYGLSLSYFKPHFHTVCALITLVFGIIWIVRMLKYLRGMLKDRTLSEGVRTYYETEVVSDAGLIAAIRMKNVLLMFLLSSVALFPLQFDNLYVLPSAIFALILTLAFRILASFDKLALFGMIPAACTAVLSVIGTVLQVPYFAEYIPKHARYLSNAIRLYKPIRIFGTAEFICAFLLFGYFIFILCRVLKRHAALVGGPSHGLQYSAQARASEILRSVYGRVALLAVVGGAYLLLRAASFTVAMYFEAIWSVQLIVAIAFVVVVIYAVSVMIDYIYERLENRY